MVTHLGLRLVDAKLRTSVTVRSGRAKKLTMHRHCV